MEQVVGLLPDADESDGHLERILDGEDDTSLGGRVELGQDDPREPDRLVEGLRLGEAVLAGGRVEHEERLRCRAREPLVDDPANLRELVHEVDLGV